MFSPYFFQISHPSSYLNIFGHALASILSMWAFDIIWNVMRSADTSVGTAGRRSPLFFSRTLSVPLAKNISGAPCILVGAYFHRQHWLADANTSVIMVLTFGVLALFSRCRSCAVNPSPTFHTSYCQHFCAEPVSLIVSMTFVMLYTIVVCRAHKWCQPDTTPSSVLFVSNRQPRFFRFATILPH